MYPQALMLQPPRSLRLMVYVLIAGAVFLFVRIPDGYAAICGVLMVSIAVGLWQASARHRGACIVLLSDGRWLPPDGRAACTLAGSSAQLAGVFWLHGVTEEGRHVSLMVMPDALADASAYRRLCVWFRTAGARLS
jgi:hypothetical protein